MQNYLCLNCNKFSLLLKLKRMKNRLLVLFATVLLITSCSKKDDKSLVQTTQTTLHDTERASEKIAAKASHSITGSVHYTYTTDFDLPCDCGSAGAPAGNYTGSGTFTHLGLSSSKIKPCLSPIFSGATMIGQHVGVECGTLVAANGDELYINILPYDIMFSGSDAIGVCNIDIIGGTGRFTSATGHLSGTANVHLLEGTADLTGVTGTIYY
jgi:hypothetical protein